MMQQAMSNPEVARSRRSATLCVALVLLHGNMVGAITLYIYIFICIYIYMYINIYIYIYILIHTFICIYIYVYNYITIYGRARVPAFRTTPLCNPRAGGLLFAISYL